MKENILVLIKNKHDPSSYYRIYQYFEDRMSCENIVIKEQLSDNIYIHYYRKKRGIFLSILLWIYVLIRSIFFILQDILYYHSKIIVINRKIFPRYFPLFLASLLKCYLCSKKVYWDFDDDIIGGKEISNTEKEILEEVSNKIIVTHEYLKNTLPISVHSKVVLLYTTDKMFENYSLHFQNDFRDNSYDTCIKLIWIGTRNNLEFLMKIIPILDKTALKLKETKNKNLELIIVSNSKVVLATQELKIKNILWSRAIALEELKYAHMGLMPLPDTSYARGKGGFKAVQYIGSGIPAIVSNIGFNNNVIQHNYNGYLIDVEQYWGEYIYDLATNKEKWIQCSLYARKSWEIKFNSKIPYEFWKNIINLS